MHPNARQSPHCISTATLDGGSIAADNKAQRQTHSIHLNMLHSGACQLLDPGHPNLVVYRLCCICLQQPGLRLQPQGPRWLAAAKGPTARLQARQTAQTCASRHTQHRGATPLTHHIPSLLHLLTNHGLHLQPYARKGHYVTTGAAAWLQLQHNDSLSSCPGLDCCSHPQELDHVLHILLLPCLKGVCH
jgi:hypothetical protein